MRKNWVPYIVSLVVLGGAFVFILICLLAGLTRKTWVDTGTLLAALFTVLAFIVSFITYKAIDSVNVISSLEGNVLENEGYRTNLYRLISDIKEHRRKKGLGPSDPFSEEDFLEILEEPYKRGVISGTQLADSIQQTIDYLVFIPFLLPLDRDQADATDYDKIGRKLNELIDLIGKRVRRFEMVNAGSNILVKESYNLIQATIYLQFEKHFSRAKMPLRVLMPAVRGTMLKNPISKVVYFDYLGLFYMHKAEKLMTAELGQPVYSVDGLKACLNGKLKNTERVIEYLKMALKEYQTALNVIGDDIMWNSFIQYNKARVSLLETCLSKSNQSIQTVFDDAIEWRHRLSLYLDDVFGEDQHDSDIQFFKNAFKSEELMVRLQKIEAIIAIGAVADPAQFEPVLEEAKAAIMENRDFGRLAWRYNDILEHLWA